MPFMSRACSSWTGDQMMGKDTAGVRMESVMDATEMACFIQVISILRILSLTSVRIAMP